MGVWEDAPLDLRRHDEDVRPVEQQQDLLRERGSELAEVGAATKILERRHDDRRLAVPRRDRRRVAGSSRAPRPTSNCCSTTTVNPANRTATTSNARTRRHRRRLRADSGSLGTSDGIGPSSTAADGCAAPSRLWYEQVTKYRPRGNSILHRIVASFVGVVLGQAASQAARLDSHERIGLRVEVRRPAEHFYRNRVALQSFPLTGQGLLDDEAQEIRGAGRLLEAAARENPFEPCAYLDGARLGRAGGRRGNVVRRVRNGDHRLVQRQPAAARLGSLLNRQCRRRSRALRRVEKTTGGGPNGYRNGRFGGSNRGSVDLAHWPVRSLVTPSSSAYSRLSSQTYSMIS